MTKTGIVYDKATGENITIVNTSKESDLILNCPADCDLIVMNEHHDVLVKPEDWKIVGNNFEEKTKAEKDKYKKDKENSKKMIV